MIKNIKLFSNDNIKSLAATRLIKDEFIRRGFKITDNEYDLGIAVGGDGSFLRMIADNDFNSDVSYVGINLGTLGFAQDVNLDKIDKLMTELESESYRIEEIGIQETEIRYNDVFTLFCSMNEIVLRDINLGAVKVDINIDGNLFERYVGDGILVATSFGSTAQNLSYGGSIVYNTFPSLQITPIAPINSSVYNTLRNSLIVPEGHEIEIIPYSDKKDIIVTVDGKYNQYENVSSIVTRVRDKKVKCLRLSSYNFPQKINDKMLKR